MSLLLTTLSPLDWCLLLASALMIGMAKTGIQGIGTLVVPMLAFVFGAKPSTGILLPMLCMADIFAVFYYRRHANWKFIFRLVPWAIVGFLLALWIDSYTPARQFKILIAICILIGLIVLLWSSGRKKNEELPNSFWLAALFGVLGGFTTMIGNAAGPIMAVYLLAMRLPKNDFVGTGAWYFLVVNLLKVPLQIFAWNNITPQTFALNLMMLPFIALGAVIGIYIVRQIPENWFRRFVIVVTLASALMLLF